MATCTRPRIATDLRHAVQNGMLGRVPKTGYALFCKEVLTAPNLPAGPDRFREAARRWKALTPAAKAVFVDRAKAGMRERRSQASRIGVSIRDRGS
eukprot:10032319-Lingulodinium_polyedra.AAC.1